MRQNKPAALTERFERKFYIQPPKISFAAHLLRHCCRCDPVYPEGVIHSVYYDTGDLDCFNDSDEGNYVRNKVRIRWYDGSSALDPTIPVFLELKSKRGFAGTKQRSRYDVESHRVGNGSMADGVLDYGTVRDVLSEFGYFPNKQLQPMILITYRRLRFEDMLTGMRISLDWDIRSTLVSRKLNRCEGSVSMSGGVIEIKGPSTDLPATLRSLRLLDTDWSRYSKYSACMESQLHRPGSVGRVHPSGRVEKL